MELTVCYRIESKHSGTGFMDTCGKDHDYDKHRDILHNIRNKHRDNFDGIYGVTDGLFTVNHYCAFANLESLMNYMTPDEIIALHEMGFNILMLSVQNPIIGSDGMQIAYLKSKIVKSENFNEEILKMYDY